MPPENHSSCGVILRRAQLEKRLARKLEGDGNREGCIIWLAKRHFTDPEVDAIRGRLKELVERPSPAFPKGYPNCFIKGERRYFVVPFAADDPVHGMAKVLVRKNDKVTYGPDRRPCYPPPASGPEQLEQVDRIAHVGFSKKFRARPANGLSLAEEIFGSAPNPPRANSLAASWERVSFVGRCQRVPDPSIPDPPKRVQLWVNSRAYLWLNREAGTDFAAAAAEVCRLLHCRRVRSFPVSRLLEVYVPAGWDAYQFTTAAMDLRADGNHPREAKPPPDPAPWAVIHLAVDRLFEPLGRIPLVVRRNGLWDPKLKRQVATRDLRWNCFLPNAFRQIGALEAWGALQPDEWKRLSEVKVAVIDCAVWREHRDLAACNPEGQSKDFCQDPAWNMPWEEHARRNVHGTVCAGLIGAQPSPHRGRMGFRGVAPGVQLFFARAFGARRRNDRWDDGRPPGYWLLFSREADQPKSTPDDVRQSSLDRNAVAEAIRWAAIEMKCDVISMSFEMPEMSQEDRRFLEAALTEAAKHGGAARTEPPKRGEARAENAPPGGAPPEGPGPRGCVLVSAAGNSTPVSPLMRLPAIHPDVMRVGATSSPGILSTGITVEVKSPAGQVGRRKEGIAVLSKYLDNEAKLALDIAAPGLRLVSTSHPYLLQDEKGHARQQFYTCGIATSDAAPLVAGAAALLFAINPALTAREVREILRQTALASAPVCVLRENDAALPMADGFGPFGELDVAAACEEARRRRAG